MSCGQSAAVQSHRCLCELDCSGAIGSSAPSTARVNNIVGSGYAWERDHLHSRWYCVSSAQRLARQLPQVRCIASHQNSDDLARSGLLQCRVGRSNTIPSHVSTLVHNHAVGSFETADSPIKRCRVVHSHWCTRAVRSLLAMAVTCPRSDDTDTYSFPDHLLKNKDDRIDETRNHQVEADTGQLLGNTGPSGSKLPSCGLTREGQPKQQPRNVGRPR